MYSKDVAIYIRSATPGVHVQLQAFGSDGVLLYDDLGAGTPAESLVVRSTGDWCAKWVAPTSGSYVFMRVRTDNGAYGDATVPMVVNDLAPSVTCWFP
jgi:hypothetical protein